jgi:hypothetical protein
MVPGVITVVDCADSQTIFFGNSPLISAGFFKNMRIEKVEKNPRFFVYYVQILTFLFLNTIIAATENRAAEEDQNIS